MWYLKYMANNGKLIIFDNRKNSYRWFALVPCVANLALFYNITFSPVNASQHMVASCFSTLNGKECGRRCFQTCTFGFFGRRSIGPNNMPSHFRKQVPERGNYRLSSFRLGASSIQLTVSLYWSEIYSMRIHSVIIHSVIRLHNFN